MSSTERRYHLSVKGPAPCNAREGNCPLGGEHYPTLAEASRKFEECMEQKFGDYSTKQLSELTPSLIDERLLKVQRTFDQLNETRTTLTKRGQTVPEPVLAKLKKDEEALRKIEQEFERRGGWSRAFLVTNVGGHVHRSMSCPTTRPTTKFALMTDFSGRSEQDIVQAAGESACTVCYPDAPVSSLRRPRTMLTEKERQEREYETRRKEEKKVAEKLKAERAAKKRANELTTPDGEPVVVKDLSGGSKVIKSLGTAKKESEYAMHWLIRRKDNIDRGLTGGSPEGDALNRANFKLMVEAIAAREGKKPEELQERIIKKEAKRYAEGMEFSGMPSPKGLEGSDYVDYLVDLVERVDFSGDGS